MTPEGWTHAVRHPKSGQFVRKGTGPVKQGVKKSGSIEVRGQLPPHSGPPKTDHKPIPPGPSADKSLNPGPQVRMKRKGVR